MSFRFGRIAAIDKASLCQRWSADGMRIPRDISSRDLKDVADHLELDWQAVSEELFEIK
jgi:hypothetical protein